MRFASLGSGSEGNGLLIQCEATAVLLDCGFSLAETTARLSRLGVVPQQLTALLVTHEHSDHIAGVARLARRYDLPVYASFGTLAALRDQLADSQLHAITSDVPFALEALAIEPFAVPHDAREPLQFVVGNGNRRLGVLTDVGCSTPHIEAMLKTCDALFLETNYDPHLLKNGPYPPQLKERVSGRFGHLSNDDSAALLSRLDLSRLQRVVAAHVSKKNNTPQLAQAALARVLGCAPE
ncbi:MAG: MBL fold metallo-hydrolase, partial [Ferrovum sp.]|nr:MBL fold metallo-hydrolase [Ferrovum sp.]